MPRASRTGAVDRSAKSEQEEGAKHRERSPGATQGAEKPPIRFCPTPCAEGVTQSPVMELGGLEPPTSWVLIQAFSATEP